MPAVVSLILLLATSPFFARAANVHKAAESPTWGARASRGLVLAPRQNNLLGKFANARRVRSPDFSLRRHSEIRGVSRHPPVAKKFQTLSTRIRGIFPRAQRRWRILRHNSAPGRNRTVDAVRGRRGTRGISLCRL